MTTPEPPSPEASGTKPANDEVKPRREAKPKATQGGAKKGSKPTTSKPVPSPGNGGGTRRA